jgi:hypothetical protein
MRNKALNIAYLSLIGVVLFYSGCKKKQDVSGKPETLKYLEMFRSSSPFFQKIDPNSTIDPNSPGMIQNLVAEANKGFVGCNSLPSITRIRRLLPTVATISTDLRRLLAVSPFRSQSL